MTLDLRENVKLHITRASHVELDADDFWWADTGPSGGPVPGGGQEPWGGEADALRFPLLLSQ